MTQVFITGTGTDVGKTLVCCWLCLHTGFDYFKPIQTGVAVSEADATFVSNMAKVNVHDGIYAYDAPLSPHLAARLAGSSIDLDNIKLPSVERLIVEGAGGVLVPLNERYLMIDLIQRLKLPVILVASSELGTINHTLLSLAALRSREIAISGVIVNGHANQDNCDAIEFYGKTKVLAQVPLLPEVSTKTLWLLPLPDNLKRVLQI
jgi:dethiobiotin synthetase